jgi:hypothetical protein
MSGDNLREAKWNPARVIAALGKIGYQPVSALLDMVDNSVSNNATRVAIRVLTELEQREGPGRRRAFVSGFEIADDGCGMSEGRLDDALALGSSDDYYPDGTLSKFGMGMKSASASLGRRLTIISRDESGPAHTAVLDHDTISELGRYVYSLTESNPEEVARLDEVAAGSSGTLIVIDRINREAMMSPADIVDGLGTRAGVVYNFHLTRSEDPIEMTVNDEPIEPKDPLFVAEAMQDLSEYEWSGLAVQWIQRPQLIQLNEDGSLTATVAMTQLPHPPSVAKQTDTSQAQCRERYMIGAGQYGFYIYRNGRLISWAESLGMVPQDQDLYSFRGRLDIDSDADDVLNLDVTKSRIHLSEIARDQLTPLLSEGVKKSRAAWQQAGNRLKRLLEETPHDAINEDLSRISGLEERDDQIDLESAPAAERDRLEERRREAVEGREATDEEQRRVKDEAQVVQYVDVLENNQLWERAHDPTHGLIVRVNRSHRFLRELVEGQSDNPRLIKVLDIVLFALARAEYSLVYKSDFDGRVVESAMDEFRERAGGELSEITRRLNVNRIIGTE